MRHFLRIVLFTVLALAAWTSILAAGAYEGWWHRPLARSGDARAFMTAAIAEIDKTRRGNSAFVLIENGKVFGEHFTSAGQPVDRNTLFQAASLSKWLAAWGVMTLVEAGKLDLDAPAPTYLTRWSLPQSTFDNNGVTVRRLLSQTAGLTDCLDYRGFKPGERMQSLEESLTHADDGAPRSVSDGIIRVGKEPGKEFNCSPGGFTLLQLIVEEVSGQSFNDYMRKAVFLPLGMLRTTHSLDAGTANIAELYNAEGKPVTHNRFTALAAASLYTSAADMTRFLQAHTTGRNGEPAGRGVLTPKTLEEMRRQHAAELKFVNWGLGLIRYASNNAGGVVIGYDGQSTTTGDSSGPDINTSARVDPHIGNGIVILGTGNDIVASTLGGEWVFWRTGNRDFLTIGLEIAGLLKVLAVGWVGIPVMGIILGWMSRPRRSLP